jgi:threonine/homoserine efflux transporter RhtA
MATIGVVLMVPPIRMEQSLDPAGVILALAAGAA